MVKQQKLSRSEIFDYDIEGIRETARFAVKDWLLEHNVQRQLAYAERAVDLGDTEYVLYFDTIDDLKARDLIVELKKALEL